MRGIKNQLFFIVILIRNSFIEVHLFPFGEITESTFALKLY